MSLLYYYTARNADGALVRGSVEASSENAALSSLRTRSLFVTSLEGEGTARGALLAAFSLGSVSQKSLVAFFRSFATLIAAGVPMRRSLEVTIEQCAHGRMREALSCIVNDIENGLALSEAMARHPKEFGRVFVATVKAGELGGALDEVLERLANVVERDRALRKRVAAALAYPAAVASAALALIAFLLVSVVPMFRSMYDQMHVPLPWITADLLAFASALKSPLVWLAGAAAVVVPCAIALRLRGGKGATAMEGALERLPIVGPILRKSTISRMSRMLGTLLESGVGLVSALDVAADAVTGAAYRESLLALRQALAEGSSISQPLASSRLYEPLFIQMIRVGEETGALDAMLLRVADYYDLDVETALAALGSLLEPAMILLLGGAVGFIVAAIFIPLYTLIGNIR